AARTPDRLVQRLLRRSDCGRVAVRAVSKAVSRLPAAIDDGEQWQTRHTGRKRDRGSNRTYLLGRARDKWSTFLLPAHPPRDQAHSLRFHRVQPTVKPTGPAP